MGQYCIRIVVKLLVQIGRNCVNQNLLLLAICVWLLLLGLSASLLARDGLNPTRGSLIAALLARLGRIASATFINRLETGENVLLISFFLAIVAGVKRLLHQE